MDARTAALRFPLSKTTLSFKVISAATQRKGTNNWLKSLPILADAVPNKRIIS